YDNPGDQFAEVEFTSGGQLYPGVAWIGYPIPSTVSDPYSEAVRDLATSPTYFATKARIAIAAICDDRGAPGGAIAARIRALANRGEIPAALADVAETLLPDDCPAGVARVVTRRQAELIGGLFDCLVKHLYLIPHDLREMAEWAAGI